MCVLFVYQITPAIFYKVSIAELSYLGITDIARINELRQVCHLQGAAISNGFGSVDSVFDRATDPVEMENLMKLDFSTTELSKICDVSRKTIQQRKSTFDFAGSKYSDIGDIELDNIVVDIKESHPHIGEKMMSGFLTARNVTVQRHRIREALVRLDPQGVDERRRRSLHRRQYSVPHANALWHIDGNHKLIRLLSFQLFKLLVPQLCLPSIRDRTSE